MVAVVADPEDARNVYAASEFAGVWKSTDSGRNWKRSSQGLRSGITSRDGRALVIDSHDPSRLLYVTNDDDMRPNHPFGGVWVSLNRGDHAGL
jgi:hypothetical protein